MQRCKKFEACERLQNISESDRIDLLVKTIKEELVKSYEKFIVKIIQLFYDDNYEEYMQIKEEDITADPWRACPESGSAGVWSLRKTPDKVSI